MSVLCSPALVIIKLIRYDYGQIRAAARVLNSVSDTRCNASFWDATKQTIEIVLSLVRKLGPRTQVERELPLER